MDVVIPGPRFRSSETGIPLDDWRAAMPGVEVVPTVESALGVVCEKFREMTREVAKGTIANYLPTTPTEYISITISYLRTYIPKDIRALP